MLRKWQMFLLPIAMLPVGLIFADLSWAADLSWKDKQVPDWSEDDAKQVLADSGWVKSVTPTMTRASQSSQSPYGRNGNVGFGIPGLGFPGGGMGRRGGGYPNNNPNNNPNNDPNQKIPMLSLRWESAMPVREAELKARDVNAPTLEDEDHYAIAVYGVPVTMVNGDAKKLADDCKKNAALKREDKKDIKPTSVQVLRREDGPVIVFLFPRTKEITTDDRRVEFDAQINKLALTQSFYLEDMTFQGKVEL
jgi:hypothetical protein